ncbi:MAG: hypothetical protein HY518_03235 [Candidatus Aenigmarchaeota archaeon]|nr:hypothetical protein [Candidatus Aenigmarchaeota archaeon]
MIMQHNVVGKARGMKRIVGRIRKIHGHENAPSPSFPSPAQADMDVAIRDIRSSASSLKAGLERREALLDKAD